MFDTKQINEVVKKLLESLPPGVRDLKKDLENNFRSILQTTLTKMDLVAREEFDVQVAVLKRTREKLEQLEKKVATMEKTATKKTPKK